MTALCMVRILNPLAHFIPHKLYALSGPNQELQLDFAGPTLDDKEIKVFLLLIVELFSKIPSALITKTTGAKRVPKILESYNVSMGYLSLLGLITFWVYE